MHKNRIAKVIPLVIFSFLVFSGCKKEEQTQKTEIPAIVELMTVEQKDTPFVVAPNLLKLKLKLVAF